MIQVLFTWWNSWNDLVLQGQVAKSNNHIDKSEPDISKILLTLDKVNDTFLIRMAI